MPFAAIAAVSAVAGVADAVIGSNASQSAAQTQANAANNATQADLNMYNATVAREQPYVQAGGNALAALQYGEGLTPQAGTAGGPASAPSGAPAYGSLAAPFNPANLAQTPGYQFEMQQGVQALQDGQSAAGGVMGGNALKALEGYGQGLASTTYQQQFQDYLTQQQQQFSNLQTIAGSGQGAAANLGALGAQTASQVGSNIIGAGNAEAAGQIGSANALTGGINSLASQYLFANAAGGGNGGYIDTSYLPPNTGSTAPINLFGP